MHLLKDDQGIESAVFANYLLVRKYIAEHKFWILQLNIGSILSGTRLVVCL